MSSEDLIGLLQEQIRMQKSQMDMLMQQQQQQQQQHQQQQQQLMDALQAARQGMSSTLPSFHAYDSTSELWQDYWSRFLTFMETHSIPDEKRAQLFLTNQSPVVYKLLTSLASQRAPPVTVNELSLQQIESYMKDQFDPTRFVIRERFNYWSHMERKPGETIQELAARIRQDAMPCNFSSINDPLDEALRTRFICSVSNEAVLKAFFKCKEDDLTFAKAIQLASEVEDAAKVARDTARGTLPEPVNKVSPPKAGNQRPPSSSSTSTHKRRNYAFPPGTCYRCGKSNHERADCPHKTTTCTFCKKVGHLEVVCRQKRKGNRPVKAIQHQRSELKTVRPSEVPQPTQAVRILGKSIHFEVDTGASDNFLSEENWTKLGKPTLSATETSYQSATRHPLPTLGIFATTTTLISTDSSAQGRDINFVVTSVPRLNLLGRDAIKLLGISVDALLNGGTASVHTVAPTPPLQPDIPLQQACERVCADFPDLFKPELGCLKGVELEVQFKPNAKPKFCKPRPVPLAVQEDLAKAYDAGISKGVWEPTQFNEWGTPVVPVRKAVLPGQTSAAIRVCGDYSATVNSQLEAHRQPMPLPDNLMRSLGGGHGFSKIDLADAYNQVPLAPASQKKLALSTHRGVLLQKRLPFGISSATGYFQEIMHQLTGDLPGVAVYLDDILVSGANATEHLKNLR